MPYTKLGKTTMYNNNDATEENRQPHFKGGVAVEYDIPAGAKIQLAGWLNDNGTQKSLFFALSCHDDELNKEETIEMTFDEAQEAITNRK